jgi:hypothetical protein
MTSSGPTGRTAKPRAEARAGIKATEICSENPLPRTPPVESRRLFDRHAKAKCFELPHMTAHRAFGITTSEVVGTQFVVRDAIVHHEIRDLQNLMRDRDDGFLVAAVAFDAVIARLQRGPFAVNGPQRALNELPTQVRPNTDRAWSRPSESGPRLPSSWGRCSVHHAVCTACGPSSPGTGTGFHADSWHHSEEQSRDRQGGLPSRNEPRRGSWGVSALVAISRRAVGHGAANRRGSWRVSALIARTLTDLNSELRFP